MTVRDRAYNVIKRLKKVWFGEYCDVQAEIEKELAEALKEERRKWIDVIEDINASWSVYALSDNGELAIEALDLIKEHVDKALTASKDSL